MSDDINPSATSSIVTELRRQSTFSGCRYRGNPAVRSRCEGGTCRCAEELRDLLEHAADALEALEKDAARYRWLRSQPDGPQAPRIDVVQWVVCDEAANDGQGLRGMDLDAAVDAALAAVKAQEEGK